MPPAPGVSGNTLRQVVHTSLGGARIRVRLSNAFGDGPVTIARVRIAGTESAGTGAVLSRSSKTLGFGGKPSVSIAAGASVESDPIDFDLQPLADYAITMYVREAPAHLTGHPGSRTTSFLLGGEQDSVAWMSGAARAEHWYLVAGIDVERAQGAAVVVLGNSIADGRGSGTDKQNRWPDNLARRLQQDARTSDVAVLNAGIGGNCVLRECIGPSGLERLDRDVLSQTGARWLIVSEGVNDIGGARTPEAAVAVANALVEAYTQIVARAHARGIRVYGATILPFAGSQYDSPAREAARLQVNAWIRTRGAFDAVIDLDAAMRDAEEPSRLRADVDGGDHLHPNEFGYRVMADAIDLSLFARDRR